MKIRHMRIAICDDEKAQQEILKKYITEWADNRSARISFCLFDNAENFLFTWEEDKAFDLLVLDIEMSGMNGIALAKRLREKEEKVPILFVTGYTQYMQAGYDVEALHYLLKPLNKDKLFSVLERVCQDVKQEEKILFTSYEEGQKALFPSKIWYVEADGHSSILVMEKERFGVRENIGVVEKLLGRHPEFIPCHRSYLVNMAHVSAATKTEVVFDDGRKVPLSRGMAKSVQAAFLRRYKPETEKNITK